MLTLGVDGRLWKESMVMYDLPTQSLWSQSLGRAMRGPLLGKRLRRLPAALLTWRTWKSRHPQSTVAVLDSR